MSERERPARQSDAASQEPWDRAPLATALNTEAATTHDVACGDGYSFRLGESAAIQVEIFPHTQTVRVTMSAARIELFRQTAPIMTPEGVVFVQAHAGQLLHLTLAPSGTIDLAIAPTVPRDVTERPTMPVDTGVDKQLQPSNDARGNVGDLMTAATLSEQGTPSTTEDSPEKQQRITIAGRVGKAPHLRTRKSGRVVASFPVAMHNEDGSTTWRTVVAFDARAKKLQETVTSGQLVEVIGYLHERETKTKGGKPKTVQEVYAAVVKTRT